MAAETDETTRATRHPGRWAAGWLATHDPGGRAAKRGLRAAVVAPAVFALADVGLDNTEIALFAAFGAMGFLLFASFGGTVADRLRAYVGLTVVGSLFIVTGTLCSLHPVLAVAAMGVVGFGVLYVGVLSPQAALGATALLLTFVLPVTVAAPAGAVPDRLAGFLLAAAVAGPVAVFVFAERWHDRLRLRLGEAATALATLVGTQSEDQRDLAAREGAEQAVAALRAQYEATPYRPTGAGPDDVAVTTLVGRLEWVAANAVPPDGGPAHRALVRPGVQAANRAVADVLADIDAVLCGPVHHRPDDATQAAADTLRRDLGVLGERSQAVSAAAVDALLGAVDGPEPAPSTAPPAPGPGHPPANGAGRPMSVVAELDPSIEVRVLASATEMAGDAALRSIRPTTIAGRWRNVVETWRRVAVVGTAGLSPSSVWLRNSVRGAISLMVAVAVVEMTDVQHGFWVVLGTLSVLRSNALGTGSTAVRALSGTVIGFIIGSAIMVGIGGHTVLLWAFLPVAVLVAGFAPTAISFAAGQAAFTVVVVILFNLLDPSGWQVGLLRVEDVAIGCGVSLVVGFLFWPRGAATALAAALGRSFEAASSALMAAVVRITGGGGGSDAAMAEAVQAENRLDDAYRQYLSERGAKSAPLESITALLTSATRLRLMAQTLDDMAPTAAAPDHPIPEALVRAGRAVSAACADEQAWYAGLGKSLADGRAPDAAPPVGHDIRRHLVRAFDEARRAGEDDAMIDALRLLWAEMALDNLHQMEGRVAGAAARFVGAPDAAPAPLPAP